jgi:pimeloyl-ACP methyl ester carboxylesterase
MSTVPTRLEPGETRHHRCPRGGLSRGRSRSGRPALLLHGLPYDIHSYVEVAPRLADSGYRWLFLTSADTDPLGSSIRKPRDLVSRPPSERDVIDLIDALDIPQAVLAGYYWGGRAACVAAPTVSASV